MKARTVRTRRLGLALMADVRSFARHGRRAPRRFEQMWIGTSAIERALVEGCGRGASSGRVVGGDWDLATQPIGQAPHVRQGLKHWRDGIAWEQTGAYDDLRDLIIANGGKHQGYVTTADVADRYRRLDSVYEQVRSEGRLRSSRELDPRAIRESIGILIHLDRYGRPVFNGSGGCHRLGMAIALELPTIPVQVGTVHASAPADWRRRIAAGSTPAGV